ncbi:MAG: MnmC family methyltransferase [Gammaproteobacteria bacterium]|nr:MnmC family methyltransferase [Gammaproteobacteria bacterium]
MKYTEPYIVSFPTGKFAFDANTHYRPMLQHGIEITREIARHETAMGQHVIIYDTTYLGRAIYIDGSLQSTQKDNFAYREMLTHVPMQILIASYRSNPSNVLVIGGGDGGVVAEVLKYPFIEGVVWQDLDEEVVNIYSTYMPERQALHDSRVDFVQGDATLNLRVRDNSIDLVLIDGVDPVQGASLYNSSFYNEVKRVMTSDAILATMTGTIWPDAYMYSLTSEAIADCFNDQAYYWAVQGSCTPGTIGFLLAGSIYLPAKVILEDTYVPLGLKYYNARVHNAAFAMPDCFKKTETLVPPQNGGYNE